MARAKNNNLKNANVSSSTYIYISVALVLAVLVGTIYTFGMDFGFIHIGGTYNVNVLYGGAILAIFVSYIVDVLYIKEIKKFYKHPDSYTSFIPYFNFASVLPKKVQYVVWGLATVAALVALPAYTFIGQYFPVNYLILLAGNSIYIILACMAVYTVIRGYYLFKFKTMVERIYKKEISSSYGIGGATSYAAYAIYFLPIIRLISILTDLNFIKNVRMELDEIKLREE